MAEAPVKRPVEISDTRGESGTDVVQGRSRVVVGFNEAVGVNLTILKTEAVDDVALETGDFLSIDHLSRTRSRLRILSSHSTNAHNSLVGSPDENDTHLKQQLDLALNRTLAAVVKELCAVAALEEKSVALCDIAEVSLQSNDFIGMHQRGEVGEFLDCFGERLWVRVVRRLLHGL
ncbi:hypothetical protein HG531_012732 [Fusarium graminearum]|nr:hypothetical protein HG531_012732 [Fusarium graminearum]